ncbi:glycosyltransferase family 2 protein [Iodobacter fluviatilis]|uniref:Glycosyltransferase family 2 protein n=1 Tax=Iodobacter fluviatilis TaxID=537 RepID=A0A7G3GA77_9NEIS|nr:glycosyltransferase family 2 protein [Iodobacter fluviatilis]QBC43665.1 glycosyltransferase family 2 protein [Iodobacter fluviatilis]
MIHKLLFYWFFYKKQFAEALAYCDKSLLLRSDFELYAAYRLGLYEAVANCSFKPRHWRGNVAIALSLAACGRHAKTTAAVHGLLTQRSFTRHKAALAVGLTSYMPELAFDIIQDTNVPVGLRAALFLATGQQQQAADLLRANRANNLEEKPEQRLLLSNAVPSTPAEKLTDINIFLTSYSLSPLALCDNTQPPSVLNLKPACPLPSKIGPLLTVLMTAYQASEHIEAAIYSVLAQTYQNIEIIVINDGSTDKTEQIVRAIALSDPRVIYLGLPCNVGTFVAKNIGLSHSSGEFVTCHDSDDWSHPMRLERQIQPLLDNEQLVFTTSQWVRIQDNGIYFARQLYPLLRLNPASPLFRKHIVLKHAGGWDAVRTGADSEFLARLELVFGSKAMHRVAQPLAFGAHRPDSLMTAKDTGYCTNGISPNRMAYWQSFTQWHIDELRNKRKPYIATGIQAARFFTAPDSIQVSSKDIARCMNQNIFIPSN